MGLRVSIMDYRESNNNTSQCDNASSSLSHESSETAKSAFSSSGNFIQTSKRNPCPICSDASGACRQGKNDQDYWLCMTFIDWRKGEVIGDYRCLGSTKNGQWAQFKPDNSQEWSEEKRRVWEAEKERRNAERAKEEEESKKKSLAAEKRHEEYSRLFAELKTTNGLQAAHKADLIRRGLTNAQIELIGAVSFVGFQKLQREYSELLPGIAFGGRSISLGGSGYIYPIRNAQGQIQGAQIRAIVIGQDEPSHEGKTQSKYMWLSGGGGRGTLQIFPDSQQRGELPLAAHFPSEIKSLAIGLCEGTGVKPFLAAQRLGIPVIGAAGGQHASSPRLLKTYIREIRNWFWKLFNPSIGVKAPVLHNVNKCNIQFYPDAGCLQNPNVLRQIGSTLHLLRDYFPVVAWWNQIEKSAGDIDEINISTPITFLTDSEFLALANPKPLFKPQLEEITPEAVKEDQKVTFCITSSVPEESQTEILSLNHREFVPDNYRLKEKPEWVAKNWNRWTLRRKFSAQKTSETTWFEYELPAENTLFLARSGIGSGKTTQLTKWLTELKNEGCIVLGYRNTLLIQFCELLNRLLSDGFFEHLHVHNGKARISDQFAKLLLCVDSLLHFSPEDFNGKNLVIDELMSVILHLHTSSTIKFPDKIQYLFSEAIKRCKRVICFDGLLADWAVDYLKAIDPTKEIVTVKNIAQRDKAPINLLLGTEIEEKIKALDHSPWLKMVLEESRLPAICSDSRDFCEAMEKLLTAKGLKVLRVDSKTVSEKNVKDFLEDCDDYIEREKPDALVYSPSAESGLNISIKGYFTEHFSFFFGVLGVDSIIQMLGRIRDTCPKFVWATEWSRCADTGMQSSHEEVIRKAHMYGMTIDAMEATSAALELLENAKEGMNHEELLEKIKEASKTLKSFIKENDDQHFRAACTLQAIKNFERSNLRECLIHALREENYKVKLCVGNPEKAIATKVKSEKKEVRLEKCLDIFNAEMIPVDLVRDNSYDATWKERCENTNAIHRKRFPGIETTEIWSVDYFDLVLHKDRNFLNSSELRWLLKHPQVALRMQQTMWSKKLSYPPEQISLIRLRSRRAVVEALRELEIEQYLEPGATFHQDCGEFKATAAMGRQKDIAAVLGFQPGKQSPAQYVGKLLALIGYELGSEQTRGEDSERKRTYFVKDSNAATRSIVLECISRKWGDYLEKSEPLFWESQKIAPVPMTDKTELGVDELEDVDPSATVTDASDIGKLFDVQTLEGINGASSDTFKITWEPGYKLLELPSKHREFYVFESPEGSRTVAYEGEFLKSTSHSPCDESILENEDIPEVFQIFS